MGLRNGWPEHPCLSSAMLRCIGLFHQRALPF